VNIPRRMGCSLQSVVQHGRTDQIVSRRDAHGPLKGLLL
jgi:hypothetical protein